jgi:diguanylate cyclase (GGDEF)-like protein
VAEKILIAFEKPFELGVAAMSVTASIGIALFPHQGRDVEELLCHADAAMYQAKQAGRDELRTYHEPPGNLPGGGAV